MVTACPCAVGLAAPTAIMVSAIVVFVLTCIIARHHSLVYTPFVGSSLLARSPRSGVDTNTREGPLILLAAGRTHMSRCIPEMVIGIEIANFSTTRMLARAS